MSLVTQVIKLDAYERDKFIFFIKVLKNTDSLFICDYYLDKLMTGATMKLTLLLEIVYKYMFISKIKYIDKTCYFVDYENLNKDALQYLKDKKNSIIYFITNQYCKLDLSKIDKSNLVYVDVHIDKYKNSADYILNMNLLSLVDKYNFKKVVIVSNDNGFNGIVEILNTKYHQLTILKRKHDIVKAKKVTTKQAVFDVKKLIKKANKKMLPKEKDALKRYIQNNLYSRPLDQLQLEEVIDVINKEGLICLYGNTIHYQGAYYYGS